MSHSVQDFVHGANNLEVDQAGVDKIPDLSKPVKSFLPMKKLVMCCVFSSSAGGSDNVVHRLAGDLDVVGFSGYDFGILVNRNPPAATTPTSASTAVTLSYSAVASTSSSVAIASSQAGSTTMATKLEQSAGTGRGDMDTEDR
ncbi:hypothetical protein BGX26_004092 [Mortierella sp. AD094]|nr:hypothetical protein BGX26_004092 [Mortierella sp. AD094]